MNKVLLSLTTALLLLPSVAGARSRTSTTTNSPTTTSVTGTTTATTATQPAAAPTTATTPAPGKIVHVNSAGAAELTTIPGINAKVAADVIKNRPYKNADELVKKVRGIGPKNVKKMLPYIDFR